MEQTYLEDILSQPESLKKCAEALKKQERIMQEIKQEKYEKIVLAGMGSSNYGLVAADIFLAEHGFKSYRYSASELLHHYKEILDEQTLLILVSQSGESAEIINLLNCCDKDVCIVGITNNKESTLSRKSKYRLFMEVESEQSVTTRTYMAGMAITLCLSMVLAGFSFNHFLKGLLKVVKRMEGLNERCESIKKFTPENNSIWILGRGIDYGSALSSALFLREVARVDAISECCGEFRHGPFEVVDSKFYGIVIDTQKHVHSINAKLVEDIQKKGGTVLFLSPWKESLPGIKLPVCDDWYQPFLSIIPIQILANELARQKGIRAGEFRWGSKVTKTE